MEVVRLVRKTLDKFQAQVVLELKLDPEVVKRVFNWKKGCQDCSAMIAQFGFPDSDSGSYCAQHQKKGMVNLFRAPYPERRFKKNIARLGGIVVGEYKGAHVLVDCICSQGHPCRTQPADIQQGDGMCRICAGMCPKEAEKRFRDKVRQQGGTVEGEYTTNRDPVTCRCKLGHICHPRPHSLDQGQGMCFVCAGQCPKQKEEEFREKVAQQGGTVLGKYNGKDGPIACICREGHLCHPQPCNLRRGGGICIICAGLCPKEAERKFRERVKQHEGIVVGEYVNSATPVECKCKMGHSCRPRPGSLRTQGMCPICAKNSSTQAKAEFYERIKLQGGIVKGEYKSSHIPVACRCKLGHLCHPCPSNIRQGSSMCRVCIRRCPEQGEKEFRERVAQQGGTVEGEYKGNGVRVKCKCKLGHMCKPSPNGLQQGYGMCRTCSERCPQQAEKEFRERVAQYGGIVEGEYRGNKSQVLCKCSMGHSCNPRPNDLQQRGKMCSLCNKCSMCEQFSVQGETCHWCKGEVIRQLKRKEIVVRKHLEQIFHAEESDIFIYNQRLGPYFPDFLFYLGEYSLIVEVDEHQHRGYGEKRERERMIGIREELGQPCIFLRYNPDSKHASLDYLVEKIKMYMITPPSWDEDELHVDYLFYKLKIVFEDCTA